MLPTNRALNWLLFKPNSVPDARSLRQRPGPDLQGQPEELSDRDSIVVQDLTGENSVTADEQ